MIKTYIEMELQELQELLITSKVETAMSISAATERPNPSKREFSALKNNLATIKRTNTYGNEIELIIFKCIVYRGAVVRVDGIEIAVSYIHMNASTKSHSE